MTAVQNLTKVFRAGHWQVRDLLQEVAVAFGDRDTGWASLISGCVTAWPGAKPGDRRQGFVFISHLGTVHLSDSSRSPPAVCAPAGSPAPTAPPRCSPGFVTTAGWCGSCVCGGSCSRAYAPSGNQYAEVPWCSYRPGTPTRKT